MSVDLRLDEDRTFERADARWFRLICTSDPDCVRIEARIEPASGAEALIDAFREAHARLHVAEQAADA